MCRIAHSGWWKGALSCSCTNMTLAFLWMSGKYYILYEGIKIELFDSKTPSPTSAGAISNILSPNACMAWSQTWSKSIGIKNRESLERQTCHQVRENYWTPYFVTVNWLCKRQLLVEDVWPLLCIICIDGEGDCFNAELIQSVRQWIL